MHIVRFSPLERIDSVRRQIDRVFADIEEVTQNSYSTWSPTIELLEDEDYLILRMQLAGIDSKNIEIQVTKKSVIISGELHRLEAGSHRYLHSEFNYGKFQREISLPIPVVNNQVTANYEVGILTLKLPKAEEAKQRVVKINLGNTTVVNTANSNSSLPETEVVEKELAVANA